MNPQGQIPRSRGGICGLLLILLGLWGGLAPFIGPYFHFGYTPDSAWQYNSGRLYFSVIPGAAALLGGLLVAGTRSRAAGVLGGFLAVLGGAWFALGDTFMTIVLKKTYSIGQPIAPSGGSLALGEYLESLALFAGVGTLIMVIGAIAMGRLSQLAARDVAADDAAGSYYPGAAATAATPDLSQYPASDPGQYQSAAGQYQPSTGQFPAAVQFPAATQPQPTFPDAPTPFGDTMTGQYLPPDSTG
jgi:hypothetical protein